MNASSAQVKPVPQFHFLDARVVREIAPCECGGRYRYRGEKTGDRYRAFAVCPECHDEIEF